jgi:hypothetical protein
MNKSRLLWTVMALCILCNGILLWKIYGQDARGHRGKQEPKHIIIDALGFDDQQIQAYEELITEHRKDIAALELQIMETRGRWYQTIGVASTMEDSSAIVISALQADIERIHYRHFQEIRALCRPEQVADFEKLASQLPSLFQPKKPHTK